MSNFRNTIRRGLTKAGAVNVEIRTIVEVTSYREQHVKLDSIYDAEAALIRRFPDATFSFHVRRADPAPGSTVVSAPGNNSGAGQTTSPEGHHDTETDP